jgi:hypothetical protein
MKHEDVPPDQRVVDTLRQFDHAPSHTPAELTALSRKIVSRATALLDDRRVRAQWWEYPAGWARTLIPLGVTTGLLAAGFLLWAHVARLPVSVRLDAPGGRETEALTSQRLLYSLVGSIELDVAPPAKSAKH